MFGKNFLIGLSALSSQCASFPRYGVFFFFSLKNLAEPMQAQRLLFGKPYNQLEIAPLLHILSPDFRYGTLTLGEIISNKTEFRIAELYTNRHGDFHKFEGWLAMRIGILGFVAAISLIGALSTASATIIDVTYTGTIGSGTLDNDNFSLLYVFDTSKAAVGSTSSDIYGATGGPSIGTATLTIDGYAGPVPTFYGSYLYGTASTDSVFSPNSPISGSQQSLNDTSFVTFTFNQIITNVTAGEGVIPISVTMPFSGAVTSTGSSFTYGSLSNVTLDPTFLTVSVISDVPEPSTWALMVFGFSAVGFAAYQRRKSVARGI